jgi:hypothetical protein
MTLSMRTNGRISSTEHADQSSVRSSLRILALNLFEVSPRATQLRFLLQAAGFGESFPDDKLFWLSRASVRASPLG